MANNMVKMKIALNIGVIKMAAKGPSNQTRISRFSEFSSVWSSIFCLVKEKYPN